MSSIPNKITSTLAYAYGGPLAAGVIRAVPEDFFVDEQLGFDPCGEGEHVYLHIEKRCLTTLAVRDKIVSLAGCKPMDVGYAGLKDKWAVTRQWFSVYLPGGDQLQWQDLAEDDQQQAYLKVNKVVRHARKLKRGAHKANSFRLLVSSIGQPVDELRDGLAEKIALICKHGMPNYFGEQRFGKNNLAKARGLFASNKRMPREQRSLCLSAARSYLFNCVLNARIDAANWNRYISGDVLMLDGSRSQFVADKTPEQSIAEKSTPEQSTPDQSISEQSISQQSIEAGDNFLATLERRLLEGDIHITGPMCGRGSTAVHSVAERLESDTLVNELALIEGLDRQGVDAARRPLRVIPQQFEWHLDSEKIHLSFILPTGSYATVLIRELIECQT